jgi:uncharacterized membrane protein YjdF
MKKSGWYLIIFNLAYILGFSIYYTAVSNYEFLMYAGFMTLLFLFIIITINKTKFSNPLLWLFSFSGFLHLFTGAVVINNGRSLYSWQVFHIIGNEDSFVLRFDQVMHFFAIFVITLVAYHLLNLYVSRDKKSNFIYLVTFFMGIGWGCLVEVQELFAVVLFQKTGVGGYFDNALDLVFNTLGALSASIFLYVKK